MKTLDLGEAVHELMERLRHATNFGLPPFPASDQMKRFGLVFERVTGLFQFPAENTRISLSRESGRALLLLQGWELPLVVPSTSRERMLASRFGDLVSVLERLAALTPNTGWIS